MSENKQLNNSNSDSDRKKLNIKNKNVNYSTDYHVDLLHASEKMFPIDQRVNFMKNEDNNSTTSRSDNHSNKHKDSDQESMSGYVTSHDKKNVGLDSSNKQFTQEALYGKNQNSNNTIFMGKNSNLPDVIKPSTNMNTNANLPNVINPANVEQAEKKDTVQAQPDDYDNYNELAPDAQMLKKLDMLRKLGELAQYGVKLSQNYNMNSDYYTMKYEYELHKNIRSKQNSVNWMSSLMLNCIYGVEILNDKYNPFDLKLQGWSEQINADINNYYDVFGEIYEKYNKPGKNMSPELKLILMVSGSALKFHLNNTLLSSPNKIANLPNPQYQNNPNNNQNNNQNNQNNQSNQIDAKILEQMRQQSVLDKIKQDTQKQNEILKEKMVAEHNIANQQVQDMMFLQQKKSEVDQMQAKKNKEFEEFEKMKLFFEQKEKAAQQQQQHQQQQQQQQMQRPISMNNPMINPNTINQMNQQQMQMQQMQQMQQSQQRQAPNPMNSQANLYASLRTTLNGNAETNQLNGISGPSIPNISSSKLNLELENQRRTEINKQLNQMKEQVKKLGQKEADDNDDENEDSQPKGKAAQNIKRRGISVDTSSKSSTSSNIMSDKSETSENSEQTKSSRPSRLSEVSANKKIQLGSGGGGERSLNSKNNASTFSKRKYKRNAITINT
jgi:hypothetical protein